MINSQGIRLYKKASIFPAPIKRRDRMNIAMFTNNYLPFVGGVSLSIDRLAEGLRKEGHRVFIFAPEYPACEYNDHEDVIRCKLLKYIKMNKLNFAISDIFSSHIEEKFKKLHIDIVHVHHPYWMGEKGMGMAKKYNIPVVYTYHTRLERYIKSIPHIGDKIGQWFPHYIIKQFSSGCDGIFAPTESAKEHLRRLEIRTPIEVLPTGVDFSKYRIKHKEIEKIREEYLKNRDILLFSASRLSKEKNILFLLEGLKYVKNHTEIKFKCIIGGDGPERKNIEKYLLKNQLTDVIDLLGTIPPEEINKYYLASDIFVFSSTAETQGMAVLEAMAAFLPVVAVSTCGVLDMIEDGMNGYRTKEEIKEWGDRVIGLMENPIRLKEMSSRAHHMARKYTVEAMAQKAIGVYGEMIRNGEKISSL